VLGAAIEGLGLAQVPQPIAAAAVKSGKLVQVLEPLAPMVPGVFLYYPDNRRIIPKLRAFIDHVKRRSDAAEKTRIHITGGRSRTRKRG
jgi:DNA-binding transcriptional LysR family regulator